MDLNLKDGKGAKCKGKESMPTEDKAKIPSASAMGLGTAFYKKIILVRYNSHSCVSHQKKVTFNRKI